MGNNTCGRRRNDRYAKQAENRLIVLTRINQQAFEKLEIVHQDISVGNILITEGTDGQLGDIVIDWDLCQSLEKPNDKYRSIEQRFVNGLK